ncbi:integrase core domain protein [Clostridium beijerinckii]
MKLDVELPLKLNKKKLGSSISDRPVEINTRHEFGHWEIDTVIGQKSNNDNVLLTIVERKTRYAMVVDIIDKTAEAVADALNRVRSLFGKQFSQAFKTITGDNGSEFANLSTLEIETDTKVYFTHPYSSFEKGTNERHNGLIRRFIPKGKRISDYTSDDIAFIEEWMNTLPRRILNYKTPEELFEAHLDKIYAV